MIPEKEITRISKFMSLVLRHQPGVLGISLDEQGWTSVPQLLLRMQEKGFDITAAVLEHVVTHNSKKRFAFNDDQSLIRASQGHSLDLDLGYAPQQPPGLLYHGTGEQSLASILASGLEKRNRHQVHLSSDRATALQVGQRHGRPVVLLVDAARMDTDGFAFYRSDNGVWLTEAVPAMYLSPETSS